MCISETAIPPLTKRRWRFLSREPTAEEEAARQILQTIGRQIVSEFAECTPAD